MEMAYHSIKWLDSAGNEVMPEEATHALVTEYDEEGNIIRETFGQLGDQVEERGQK